MLGILVLFVVVGDEGLTNGVCVSNETEPRWERNAATCELGVTGGVVDDGER